MKVPAINSLLVVSTLLSLSSVNADVKYGDGYTLPNPPPVVNVECQGLLDPFTVRVFMTDDGGKEMRVSSVELGVVYNLPDERRSWYQKEIQTDGTITSIEGSVKGSNSDLISYYVSYPQYKHKYNVKEFSAKLSLEAIYIKGDFKLRCKPEVFHSLETEVKYK